MPAFHEPGPVYSIFPEESLRAGEDSVLKIPDLLITSKKQGVGASSELIENLKLSNTKHREIATELLKVAPVNQIQTMEEVIKINQEIKDKLKKL